MRWQCSGDRNESLGTLRVAGMVVGWLVEAVATGCLGGMVADWALFICLFGC